MPEMIARPGCDLRGREGWQGKRVKICAGLVGKAPSCFMPLTGTDGARLRLPFPDDPNKAFSLVGAMKGA